MRDHVRLIVWTVVDLFRSRAALETEILTLRQQINVLRRAAPKKQTFGSIARVIFVCLYRLLPGVRDALGIVKPETVVKWHRAGFRLYWRCKSRARGGRPTIPLEIRRLVREMSIANPLWGAPRIHGELLKLGVDIGQTSVAKYMVRRREPCLDHVIVFGERHLRHLLLCYMRYYNGARTHLSLEKDAPVSRAVDRVGHILCRPIFGGLHHQYVRI
jgi:hypothetical protein